MTRRLLLPTLLTLCACGGGGATLEISLYTPAAAEQNPFEGVSQIRVRFVVPGLNIPAQLFDVSSGQARLTGLPLARFVRVIVEGLAGLDAAPLAKGLSRPVDLVEGAGIKLAVFFAKVDRFATNVSVNEGKPTPMMEARAGHSMTLLRDGRVLIVGGAVLSAQGGIGASPLASAEVYDPATGATTTAGRMTFSRAFHTATLLKDGRVLIVGGASLISMVLSPLATAEIYDPTTARFRVLPPLREGRGRAGHTASLLPDGSVLVAGGWGEGDSGRVALATAERFDVAAGSFVDVGSLAVARANHTATLLLNGKVLVTGGRGAAGAVASTEVFTAGATASFALGPDLPGGARAGHTASRIGSGLVLVVGGCRSPADPNSNAAAASGSGCHAAPSTSLLNRVDVFDPNAGEVGGFVDGLAPSLATPRADHAATLLPDDVGIIVTGGNRAPDGASDSAAEVIEESGGGFNRRSTSRSMGEPRVFHGTARLSSGLVMVSGGSARTAAGASFSVSSGLELYVP